MRKRLANNSASTLVEFVRPVSTCVDQVDTSPPRYQVRVSGVDANFFTLPSLFSLNVSLSLSAELEFFKNHLPLEKDHQDLSTSSSKVHNKIYDSKWWSELYKKIILEVEKHAL